MTAANIPFDEWAKFVLPKTWASGVAEGKAEAVIAVLGARGIPVSGEMRGRIAACTDIERLDAWIVRAATVSQAEDLFD